MLLGGTKEEYRWTQDDGEELGVLKKYGWNFGENGISHMVVERGEPAEATCSLGLGVK